MLALVLPFLFWLFLMRDFFLGHIPVNLDTNTIYAVIKFYFNNLLNGVVPLWEPFVVLGRPFYALPICNLFNPATQLVGMFKLFGINYYQGFMIYMAAYFWIGTIGFFFLAKEIFQSRTWAYAAYIGLLFSSLGVSMFTQLTLVEILVPTIWFFYFLAAFGRQPCRRYFWGLIFSLMIAVSSYLPFYFVTVVLVFVLCFVLLFGPQARKFLSQVFSFIQKHIGAGLVGLAGLVIALLPLLVYKTIDSHGDVVAPGRHCQYASLQECYEHTMAHEGGMLYKEIAQSGGLGERMDMSYFFSNLDKLTYGSDSLYFVSVFLFLLIALGVWLRLSRLNVLLVAMTALIALIALGSATGAHHWLYHHVFYFRYFRNLFFFGVFFLPLLILLGVALLRNLLALHPTDFSHKKMLVTGILFLHGLFAWFLYHQSHIILSSWLTVAVSAGLFCVYYAGLWKKGELFWMVLFSLLMIVQPVQVMGYYAANAKEFQYPMPFAHVNPTFAWVRPTKLATSDEHLYQFVHYEDFYYLMSMTDAPAKVGYPQSAARYTFDLSMHNTEDALANYARHKIVVYGHAPTTGNAIDQTYQPIDGPGQGVEVDHFDANKLVLTTKFTTKKFLVYNDSFTRYWKVFVNGQQQDLTRSNGAFKGVWVPPGQSLVEFRYEPPGGQWIYILVTATMLLFLILTLCPS